MSSIDNLFGVAMALAAIIFLVAIVVFWNNTVDLDEFWDLSSTSQEVRDDTTSFVNVLDFIFVLFYISLHIGTMLLAYRLRTHPVAIIVGLIISVIVVVLSAPVSNAYVTLITDANVSAAANTLPIADFILRSLPILETVFSFATLMILYGFGGARRNELRY